MPNGGIIQSTGSSITIRQINDEGVVGSGFNLTWQCSIPTSPPICNFYASTTTNCTGVINFIDYSSNGPSTWFWNFGDGTSSSIQNPIHNYLSNGTYTVKLIVTISFGSDSLVKISYITISGMPNPPVVEPVTACIGGTATLSASGSGQLEWYDQFSGGTLLDTGNLITTPILTSGTSIYVQDRMITPSLFGGKTDNSGSGGYYGNASNIHYLIFNSYQPFTLKSVKVYANGALDRTIQLRDSNQTVLQSTTITIPDGESTVTLNFPVPVGQKLQLVATGAPNLYRNNNNSAIYPYTVPGILSITESSASLPPINVFGNYYYFYNWEIKEEECISPRILYPLTINDCSDVKDEDILTFNVFPVPTEDNLYINIQTSSSDRIFIDLVDIIGKTIYSTTMNVEDNRLFSLDVRRFSPGVYFIRINESGKQHIEKIIIK